MEQNIDTDGLWSSAKAAQYFDVSVRHYQDRIATLPGFPKPVRLPAPRGGRGQPRWYPGEVKTFASQHRVD